MADIAHSIEIKTTPKKVYQAITSQEGLAGWLTPEVVIKPEVGFIGVFKFKGGVRTEMKIARLVPNKQVLWDCVTSELGDWIGTKVSFDLEEKDTSTVVHFSQTGWKVENTMYGIFNIHWERYMLSLKCLCEFGNGMPYGD